MVYKVALHITSCPYCNHTLSRSYNRITGGFGMKYARCPKCKGIYRTGKMLYSDLSPKEQENDGDSVIRVMLILFPLFAIAFIVAYFTVSEIAVCISCFLLFSIFITLISYFQRQKITLRKYQFLKEKDPELYQLEYAESVRIIRSRRRNEK